MLKVVAAFLFLLTGACLLLAGVTFSQVFDSYQDSPDSFYVRMAAIPFLIALLTGGLGAAALRSGTRQ